MALGEFLLVRSQDHGHVAEARQRKTQAVVEQNLFGRIAEMVVAAQHVRGAQIVVVDHDRQVVDRRAVGPAQHHVVEFGVVHGNRAGNHVVEHGLAVQRRLEPDHPARTGAESALPTTAVVFGLQAAGPGFLPHGLDLVGRTLAIVGMTGFQQSVDVLVVEVEALALIDRVAVPVQPEPAHRSKNGAGHLVAGTSLVRILYAQQEFPAARAGQKPVENGGPGAADVQMTGGTGGETGDDVAHALLQTSIPTSHTRPGRRRVDLDDTITRKSGPRPARQF